MTDSEVFEGSLHWPGQPAGQVFDYDHFNRDTELQFGSARIEASAGADFHGDENRTNPETLMIASLMQCHFLTFMAVASRRKVTVTGYLDNATGKLGQRDGKTRMVEVTLRPQVTLADPGQVAQLPLLHEKAHNNCFMANSVNFPVLIEPASA